jgi:hypothetical protein
MVLRILLLTFELAMNAYQSTTIGGTSMYIHEAPLSLSYVRSFGLFVLVGFYLITKACVYFIYCNLGDCFA